MSDLCLEIEIDCRIIRRFSNGVCMISDQCFEGKKREKYRKAENVRRRVCLVYLQSSLHEIVVFSVCARMGNAAYIIDTWYHFRFISCGVAVKVRSHQEKFHEIFLRKGAQKVFGEEGQL